MIELLGDVSVELDWLDTESVDKFVSKVDELVTEGEELVSSSRSVDSMVVWCSVFGRASASFGFLEATSMGEIPNGGGVTLFVILLILYRITRLGEPLERGGGGLYMMGAWVVLGFLLRSSCR